MCDKYFGALSEDVAFSESNTSEFYHLEMACADLAAENSYIADFLNGEGCWAPRKSRKRKLAEGAEGAEGAP